MLARKNRLRRSVDIEAVLKRGRVITTPYVRVYSMPSTAPHSRIACIVGKKIAAAAVVRHRYQRWLRVYAAHLLPQLSGSFDIILLARPSLLASPSLRHLLDSLARLHRHLKSTLV